MKLSSQSLLEWVGSIPLAFLLVTADTVVLEANSSAEKILKRGDLIARKSDRLASPHKAVADQLDAIIKAALTSDSTDVVAVLRRSQGPPVVIMASAMPAGSDTVGLFISDPALPVQPSHEALRGLFHLNTSEARLCAQLMLGKTLAESATALKLSVQSARTYLREVFRKTGTRRQCELVHLLLSGPSYISARLPGQPRRIQVLNYDSSSFED